MVKVRQGSIRALAASVTVALGMSGAGVADAMVAPEPPAPRTSPRPAIDPAIGPAIDATIGPVIKPRPKVKTKARSEFGFGLRLGPNEQVTSSNGKVRLIQQLDGNLVLRDAKKQPLWDSQTHGNPGARTYFQHNGNLVVVDKTEKNVLFYSSTWKLGHTLAVQDDNNLVIYNKDHKPVWSSQVQATTLYPGQRLGPNQYRRSADGRHRVYMQGDGNLIIGPTSGGSVWHTATHGHPGASATVQLDGNVVVSAADGTPLWASASHGRTPGYMTMQNDGNLVLYGIDRNPIWASNTFG